MQHSGSVPNRKRRRCQEMFELHVRVDLKPRGEMFHQLNCYETIGQHSKNSEEFLLSSIFVVHRFLFVLQDNCLQK